MRTSQRIVNFLLPVVLAYLAGGMLGKFLGEF